MCEPALADLRLPAPLARTSRLQAALRQPLRRADRAFQALLADPAPSGDLISGLRTARYAHPDVTEALRRGRAFTRLLVVKCELTTPLGSVDVVALIVGLCD